MVLVQTTLDGARADIDELSKDLDKVDWKARRAVGTLNRMVSVINVLQLPPALKQQWGIIDSTSDKLLRLYLMYQLVQTGTPWGALSAAISLTTMAMGGLQDVVDATKGNMR